MQTFAPLVDQYADFAGYAVGESACFDDWARSVIEDEEVLGWLAGLPAIKQQPTLVFAAARWHGVPAPGPYDGLREALLGDDGAIRETISTRSTQTNEVGRLATLTPLLAGIEEQEGRPLALVEPGASAGLCLYPDRYAYRWATDAGVHELSAAAPAASPVSGGTLTCTVTGPAPLPSVPVDISWRAGVDLHPLDVGDDDAMAWLTMLVWPEQDERRDRLRAAIEVARSDPPYLRAGDLLDTLPALVSQAAGHGVPVVFHSAVIAYLDHAERARFTTMMTDLVDSGACRWVSNEGPGVLPEVTDTGPAMPTATSLFVLGLDGRAVAWTHGHGRSMTWLGHR